MKSSLDFCPVPEEQQPVNEYEQLKESWFFRWATLDVASYTKKIVWLWLWPFFVPWFNFNYYPENNFDHDLN